jgi:hypothetical protein
MSNMENILHLYLCKLRIISKIPVGGKLDTTQNDLNIYYGGVFGWLFRKAYGDNKENATKYLIELYREINSFSEQLMYNINTEQNDIRCRKKTTMLVSLTEKMKESLTGIRNLIGTYKGYLKIVSLLECLEQDLIIPQYRTLTKFIPNEYHTEILKTAITYSHIHSSGIFGRMRSLSETDTCTMEMNNDKNPKPTTFVIPNDNNLKTNLSIITDGKSQPINIPTKKKNKQYNNNST